MKALKKQPIQERPERYPVSARRLSDDATETLAERRRLRVTISRDLTRVFFFFLSPGRMCQIEVPMVRHTHPGTAPRDFVPWISQRRIP